MSMTYEEYRDWRNRALFGEREFTRDLIAQRNAAKKAARAEEEAKAAAAASEPVAEPTSRMPPERQARIGNPGMQLMQRERQQTGPPERPQAAQEPQEAVPATTPAVTTPVPPDEPLTMRQTGPETAPPPEAAAPGIGLQEEPVIEDTRGVGEKVRLVQESADLEAKSELFQAWVSGREWVAEKLSLPEWMVFLPGERGLAKGLHENPFIELHGVEGRGYEALQGGQQLLSGSVVTAPLGGPGGKALAAGGKWVIGKVGGEKAAKAATRVGEVLVGTPKVAGSIFTGDALTHDPDSGTLLQLANEMPLLDPIIADWMVAIDPDAPEWEKRVRRAMQETMVGAPAAAILEASLRVYRYVHRAVIKEQEGGALASATPVEAAAASEEADLYAAQMVEAGRVQADEVAREPMVAKRAERADRPPFVPPPTVGAPAARAPRMAGELGDDEEVVNLAAIQAGREQAPAAAPATPPAAAAPPAAPGLEDMQVTTSRPPPFYTLDENGVWIDPDGVRKNIRTVAPEEVVEPPPAAPPPAAPAREARQPPPAAAPEPPADPQGRAGAREAVNAFQDAGPQDIDMLMKAEEAMAKWKPGTEYETDEKRFLQSILDGKPDEALAAKLKPTREAEIKEEMDRQIREFGPGARQVSELILPKRVRGQEGPAFHQSGDDLMDQIATPAAVMEPLTEDITKLNKMFQHRTVDQLTSRHYDRNPLVTTMHRLEQRTAVLWGSGRQAGLHGVEGAVGEAVDRTARHLVTRLQELRALPSSVERQQNLMRATQQYVEAAGKAWKVVCKKGGR